MAGQRLTFRWEAGPRCEQSLVTLAHTGARRGNRQGTALDPLKLEMRKEAELSWHSARAPSPGRDSEGLRVCVEPKDTVGALSWCLKKKGVSGSLNDLKGMGPSYPYGPRLAQGGGHEVGVGYPGRA